MLDHAPASMVMNIHAGVPAEIITSPITWPCEEKLAEVRFASIDGERTFMLGGPTKAPRPNPRIASTTVATASSPA